MFLAWKKREEHSVASSLKLPVLKMKETPASKVHVVYNGTKSRHVPNSHSEGAAEDGEGTWIFSYADMITILMMFFILLLSISSMDVQKFEQLKSAMKVEANEEASAANAGGSRDRSTGNNVVSPSNSNGRFNTEPGVGNVPFRVLAEKAAELAASDTNTQLIAAIQTLMDAVDAKSVAESETQGKKFEKMREEFAKLTRAVSENATLEGKPYQEIRLVIKTAGLFGANDILTAKGQKLFAEIAQSSLQLDPFPRISIASHFKSTAKFSHKENIARSNARALAVFDILKANRMNSDLISIAAYGSAKPLLNERDSFGNKLDSAHSANNRIVISIMRRKIEQ
jgi:chemotaxis protein MotB